MGTKLVVNGGWPDAQGQQRLDDFKLSRNDQSLLAYLLVQTFHVCLELVREQVRSPVYKGDVMRILSAIGLAVVTVAPIYAYGQEPLIGKYKGEFIVSSTFPGRPERAVRVELVIASVENGVVKGTGKSYSPSCKGAELPIEGKQQGNKLELRATGERATCTMAYSLTVEGKKLIGTTPSGYPLQLSKQ
jgi:hypothetical protein